MLKWNFKNLSSSNRIIIIILRILLYSSAFCALIYFIFPKQTFSIPAGQITHQEDSIATPRDTNGVFLKNGRTSIDFPTIFSLSPREFFPIADIDIALNRQSLPLSNPTLIAKRSFASFLLPLGAPEGFPDGSLIKVSDDFYLISNGQARKFANDSLRKQMGFSDSMFFSATFEELQSSTLGQEIDSANIYPEDTLFKFGDEDYYILKNNHLIKFVSTQAFHSRFSDQETLTGTKEIMQHYPIDEEAWEGFADGSLLSYGQAVFIVNGNYILPVNSPGTFLSYGYFWEDIINVGGDEIGLYKKTKLFTTDAFHSDGTIFQDENHNLYRVFQNQIHSLPSLNVAWAWLKRAPIFVSQSQSQIVQKCSLRKIWNGHWQCSLDLNPLKDLPGKDIQFELSANQKEIRLDQIQVTFRKERSWQSLQDLFNNLKSQIKSRYYVQNN